MISDKLIQEQVGIFANDRNYVPLGKAQFILDQLRLLLAKMDFESRSQIDQLPKVAIKTDDQMPAICWGQTRGHSYLTLDRIEEQEPPWEKASKAWAVCRERQALLGDLIQDYQVLLSMIRVRTRICQVEVLLQASLKVHRLVLISRVLNLRQRTLRHPVR